MRVFLTVPSGRKTARQRYTIRVNKQTEPRRCWRIRGYDGLTQIFDQTIPIGQITESNVVELLRALVAKELSRQELVGVFVKRGTRLFNRLLDVRKENDDTKQRALYSCGANTHFIATPITVEK